MSSAARTIDLPDPHDGGIDRYSVAIVREPASLTDLLAAVLRIAARGEGRSFVILDDAGQCLYTSGHAINGHDLDDGVEYPDDDSPEAIDRYEADLFTTVLAALRASDPAVNWASVPEEFATNAEDIDALVSLNRDPSVLLESTHVVQRVPEQSVDGLLADVPNGYFSGDWTPFQSLAVTRRLHDRYGYEPWGIGARSLAFHRPAGVLPSDLSGPLMADLQHLYGQPNSPAWSDLAKLVESTTILVLGYTEDFAELVTEA
ncbi:hypothetical protein [Microbacterium sp. ZW T5_56]|uniref:hypothetical protein n=1 Tax=Microbacterium sp. ZW T5_56 TaxID=3378081 RepID=UPI003853151A